MPNPVVITKATLNFCTEAVSTIALSYLQCGTVDRQLRILLLEIHIFEVCGFCTVVTSKLNLNLLHWESCLQNLLVFIATTDLQL